MKQATEKPNALNADISLLSLKLLQRPQERAPILPEGTYSRTTLREDLERLCVPDSGVEPSTLMNLLTKFFYAYVHPGSEEAALPPEAVTLLFDQFANRRKGCDSLEGKGELRTFLLQHGFALCMLADLPRSAHVLESIIRQKLDPSIFGGAFSGLDIGTGTGILMLGQYVAARRNGFSTISITGIERDHPVRERADRLARALGIGRVIEGDAKNPGSLARAIRGPLSFVTNETLPSQGRRLWKEDFVEISRGLAEHFEEELKAATFFPESLIAYGRKGDPPVELSMSNRFAPESPMPLRLMRAWGIRMLNVPVALEEIGSSFACHVTPIWLEKAGRRW